MNVKGDRMTSVEFENLILQYASDIDYKVNAAYKKIKKPSHLDVEDIRAEVVSECWRAFQRWYHPEKSKPRTFMNQCIVTTITDIIWKSWKEVQTQSLSVKTSDDSFELDLSCKDVCFRDLELPQTLTKQELEYIINILTQQGKTNRQNRAAVRAMLSLSVEQENGLLKELRLKFSESKDATL